MIVALAVNADGEPISAGLEGRQLVVWNPRRSPSAGESVVLCTPARTINNRINGDTLIKENLLRFSAGGGFLALVDARFNESKQKHDDFLRVFDVGASRELFQAELAKGVPCVVLSAGAKRVAVGQGAAIHLFNPHARQKVGEIAADRADIKDLAFDQLGHVLASIAAEGRRIGLWEGTSGDRLGSLEVDGDGPLIRLGLSPSGRWLAVGDISAEIAIWDLHGAGQQLREVGLDWPKPRGTAPK
jgi:WD40 repeat protein